MRRRGGIAVGVVLALAWVGWCALERNAPGTSETAADRPDEAPGRGPWRRLARHADGQTPLGFPRGLPPRRSAHGPIADTAPVAEQRLEITATSDPGLASVSGRVVSAGSGRPIPGAEVALTRGHAAYSATSDDSGRFLFETREPGQYRVAMVEAEGHAPFAPSWETSPVQFSLTAGARIQGVLFRLWPFVVLRGEVRSALGKPVAGATVSLASTHEGLARRSFPSEPSSPDHAVLTDTAGTFQIAVAGRASLQAQHPVHGTGRARADATRPEGPPVVITLHPRDDPAQGSDGRSRPREGRILGRVLDPAGDPVQGARVLATPHGSDDAEPPRATVTGPDGSFQVPGLSGGPHLVRATHPALGLTETYAAVRATTQVVLHFSPRGVVQGMVRDAATGAPVPHYTLQITQTLDMRTQPVPTAHRTVYAADGRYRVDGLNAGRYAISAAAPGFMPSLAAEFLIYLGAIAQSEAEVDLSLHRGGTLHGRVADATDGSPIAGASLYVSPVERAARLVPAEDTRTGQDGQFTVTGLPVGRCTVRVEAAGYHDRLLSGIDVPVTGDPPEPVLVTLTPVPPEESTKTEFVGIGATVSKVRRGARVVAVMPGGGAAEVGLRPRDVIVAIEGMPAADQDLEMMVNALRGLEDTFVHVAVARPSADDDDDEPEQVLQLAVPRRKLTF